jgi:hypothetical protein
MVHWHSPNRASCDQSNRGEQLPSQVQSFDAGLGAYLAMEEELGEQLVEGNASFVAVVPYWAVWPFRGHDSAATAYDRAPGDDRHKTVGFRGNSEAVAGDLRSGLRHAIPLLDGTASRAMRWGINILSVSFMSTFILPGCVRR